MSLCRKIVILTSIIISSTVIFIGIALIIDYYRGHPYFGSADAQRQSAELLTQTYDNQDSHYTIKYPADWQYDAAAKGTVIFRGKSGIPSNSSTVNIQTVLAKKTGGQFSSVKQFIVDIKKQANSQTTKPKFLDSGPLVINEPDGTKVLGQYLILTYTFKGMSFKQWQIVVMRNDEQVFYAWAYTSTVDRYQEDYAIAKAMLESWAIY